MVQDENKGIWIFSRLYRSALFHIFINN
jgi:hypothetical protein